MYVHNSQCLGMSTEVSRVFCLNDYSFRVIRASCFSQSARNEGLEYNAEFKLGDQSASESSVGHWSPPASGISPQIHHEAGGDQITDDSSDVPPLLPSGQVSEKSFDVKILEGPWRK